jgi:hypothetical protein
MIERPDIDNLIKLVEDNLIEVQDARHTIVGRNFTITAPTTERAIRTFLEELFLSTLKEKTPNP